MKAIITCSLGLASLLALGSICNAYVWVSPVTKCPLGYAPNICTCPQYYYWGSDGHLYGPYYYLRPPFPPHQPYLPGPIGAAIQSGFLPHELLNSKEAMELTLQGMPFLENRGKEEQGGKQGQGSGSGGPPPAGNPYGGAPNNIIPYGGNVPGPYPLASGPGGAPPRAPVQMPYMGQGSGMGMMPYGSAPSQVPVPMPIPMPMPYPVPFMGQGSGMGPMPYPQPIPFGQPMPYPQPTPMPYPQTVPYPQPMTPMPYSQPAQPNRPAAYYPYGAMGWYAAPQQNPWTGIWQVQSFGPMPQQNGFAPPQFNGMPTIPPSPAPPGTPAPPGMPPPPGTPLPPGVPQPGFAPGTMMPPLERLQPLQRPQLPVMGPVQMQLPRMDMKGPPPPPPPTNAYPSHPLVRSPRDFFMWTENMADERARGNRPNPVP